MQVNAETLSLKEQAQQTAQYYQEIIMRDVPGCTWTEDTEVSHVTSLYDPYGELNGIVYEYQNGQTPAGFLQVDLSSGTAALDSYSFGDEHPAAKKMRSLPSAVSRNRTSDKLVYLGGYSYYVLEQATTNGVSEVYDVLNEQSTTLNLSSVKQSYTTYVAAKSQSQAVQKNTVSPMGLNTVTKLVQGYTGMTLATYDNTGNHAKNGCTIISAVNTCMYWSKYRGKTNLYINSPVRTYNEINLYISLYDNPSGATYNDAYNGFRNYVSAKGYPSTRYGKITSANWTWSKMKSIIDSNVPITMATVHYGEDDSSGFFPDIEKDDKVGGHAVTVFGYQYIEVANTIIIADAYSTSLVYKTFSSIKVSGESSAFSYYVGW